jgi:hypothetical protein
MIFLASILRYPSHYRNWQKLKSNLSSTALRTSYLAGKRAGQEVQVQYDLMSMLIYVTTTIDLSPWAIKGVDKI